MPDYQKAKIYKLWSPSKNLVYYGSTVQSLSQRLTDHLKDFNNYIQGQKKYYTSYLILECEDYKIELLEEHPCNNKQQLYKKEGEYIRNNECVNKVIAGRTHKEYYNDNIDKLKEQNKLRYNEKHEEILNKKKQYYINNQDELLDKRKKYRNANRDKINETQRQNYLKQKENNADIMKQKRKQFYKDNADKLKEQRKKYRDANAEKIKEYKRQYREKQKALKTEKIENV